MRVIQMLMCKLPMFGVLLKRRPSLWERDKRVRSEAINENGVSEKFKILEAK